MGETAPPPAKRPRSSAGLGPEPPPSASSAVLPSGRRRPPPGPAAPGQPALGQPDVLDLDVGGAPFRAGAATLRKAPFFEALLRHREEGRLGAGSKGSAVFVDRSPTLFADVLEYLRTGRAYAETLLARARLAAEFAFFGLNPEAIQEAPGTRVQDAVVCGRYLRQINDTVLDLQEGEGVILVFAPLEVLRFLHEQDGLGNVEEDQRLWWRILPDADGCVVSDQFDLAAEIDKAAAALRRRGFSECGRSESSSMASDADPSGPNTRVWLSETVRLQRRV